MVGPHSRIGTTEMDGNAGQILLFHQQKPSHSKACSTVV